MTRVLALSGGVGGAKLALGLSRVLPVEALTVVANTGDDFEHLGLSICPDLDTLLYTLSGRADRERGWGLADEHWTVMETLAQLDGESWFRLGDRDLATHLLRSAALRRGESLGAVTTDLCRRFGVPWQLLPMTDDPVRTVVLSEEGELPFQHYFVRRQCQPRVRGFRFEGIEAARPHPDFLDALSDPALAAVVICPSNPMVSVDPILALPGVRRALAACAAPVIAVSPIIGGVAVKGPAAKMMAELDMPVTAAAVAAHYGGLLDGFVLDAVDAQQATAVAHSGAAVHVCNTLMRDLADREALAREVLDFARSLRAD